MTVTLRSCPGVKDYMRDCSEDAGAGRITRKFWKIKARWLRGLWRLRSYGFWSTLRYAGIKTLRLAGISKKTNAASAADGVTREAISLNLKPGELVEVKSEDEIIRTLDAAGRNRGLLFMPCMRKYCGQKLRVYKRLERILLESTGEYRKLKDTVLLEGAICDGSEFGGCDRSCFHYWREVWLKRLEPEDATG